MTKERSWWRSDLAEEGSARAGFGGPGAEESKKDEKTGREEGKTPGTAANGAGVSAREGYTYEEEERDGIRTARMTISNKEASRVCGRPVGRYVTLSFGAPWLFGREEKERLARAAAGELQALFGKELSKKEHPFLAVGLGNRRMTSDSVGPAVVSKITVTGQVKDDGELLALLGGRRVYAFSPGVLGDSGMESAEQTRGVCRCCAPDAILVVDALAAGSAGRLCTTIQLTDAGISPGSGVGNDRPAFNRAYFGVPVFAAGVPTVVDSSSLIGSALGEAGVDLSVLPEKLLKTLEGGRDFFVSPKEIDAAVEVLSDVLAAAVDMALLE